MCDSCEHQLFIEEINDMLNDDNNRYAFAQETLEGIQDTVSANEHVTERQREAVENIRRSKE